MIESHDLDHQKADMQWSEPPNKDELELIRLEEFEELIVEALKYGIKNDLEIGDMLDCIEKAVYDTDDTQISIEYK